MPKKNKRNGRWVQQPDPTPEEIVRIAAEIRAEWGTERDPHKRRRPSKSKRRVGGLERVKATVEEPDDWQEAD